MRSILSLLIIAFALCALAGGFFSGNAAVPRISFHLPTPNAIASTPPIDVLDIRGLQIPETDEVALDDFAGDPAVVPGAESGAMQRDARLTVVLVGCGHSYVLESPFLTLAIPVTPIVDPDGPAARAIASLAAQNGRSFFVQAQAPLTVTQIDTIERAFPGMRGIAARLEEAPAPAIAHALKARHLALFDEFGDEPAVRRELRRSGVRYFTRTITVDDHLQPTYVQYMLNQAVHLGRGGHTTVMARPMPGTLRALAALAAQADRDGIRFASL